MKGFALSDQTWGEIARQYRADVPVKLIIERFGISVSALNHHLRKMGVPPRRPGVGRRKFAETSPGYIRKPEFDVPEAPKSSALASIAYSQTASEIIRLHRNGLGSTKIAALLRMPYRQIETALSLQKERR